jgi:nucleoid DNA-binding protein
MNEKINIQDFIALLAEKANITKKEAETFLREFFEVMNESLIHDESLKIKDLGTFKLTRVENRESIDVATGERVLIPAHHKVSFSPDKNLAQIVNEPFAFFETVEIDEDTIPDEPEIPAEDEPEEEVVEDIIERVTETPIEPEKIEETVVEQTTVEETIVEEIVEERPLVEKPDKKNPWIIRSITLCVLLCLFAAGIYYYYNQTQGIVLSQPSIEMPKTDTIPNANDTLSTIIAAEGVIVKEEIVKEEIIKEPKKTQRSESKKRKIANGDRLTLIALSEYGHKVFWVYLYEENKNILKNPDNIYSGLIITIPPAQKYGIDKNNPESIKKARKLIDSYAK